MTRAKSAVDAVPSSTPVRPARPKDAVQSLERAIAVLTTFDRDHRHLTLTEVAERCRLPRSAARRFLHTLVELGYIEVSARKFTLTPQVLELGYANLSRFTLADVCQPHLEALTRNLGLSASVTVLDGPDIRYVNRVDIASGMSVSLKSGSRLPAHRTAAGRVLLAALPEAELDRHLDLTGTQDPHSAPAHDERSRLERELDIIRRQGWAFADQLLDVGVQALSVPLRSRTGRVVGALTVSMYQTHEPARTLVPRYLPPLLETAGRISLELRAGIDI
ncbi:helix-turn-helix domain-containing protein [Rhodococcus sp. HM1]|uniref:IclR family transcriptional regulator domain-containing protein n=1 Tax=unclassified Rhodococcus (in: high G+C Gram-positive bacteria) TaxID=192944 RepID=UPI0018CFCB7E|nr:MULTISPECIES: IclR family transcriptional regulator C-terminal domain-containing protein [unclassified Rhodococcus (in: high G+C Gram-positive bacteria)]MBH0119195.1 helix-turn-helix domain-containing protein [Rhodococcus sp. CX]MCK8671704.1 helix-turn-helix domain-containing protein [Rhodococcus sp. HM1]